MKLKYWLSYFEPSTFAGPAAGNAVGISGHEGVRDEVRMRGKGGTR